MLFRSEKPTITSGLRVGTPALTTRGFVEKDMMEIADLIYLGITNFDKKKELIKERVAKLSRQYPLYPKF